MGWANTVSTNDKCLKLFRRCLWRLMCQQAYHFGVSAKGLGVHKCPIFVRDPQNQIFILQGSSLVRSELCLFEYQRIYGPILVSRSPEENGPVGHPNHFVSHWLNVNGIMGKFWFWWALAKMGHLGGTPIPNVGPPGLNTTGPLPFLFALVIMCPLGIPNQIWTQ